MATIFLGCTLFSQHFRRLFKNKYDNLWQKLIQGDVYNKQKCFYDKANFRFVKESERERQREAVRKYWQHQSKTVAWVATVIVLQLHVLCSLIVLVWLCIGQCTHTSYVHNMQACMSTLAQYGMVCGKCLSHRSS